MRSLPFFSDCTGEVGGPGLQNLDPRRTDGGLSSPGAGLAPCTAAAKCCSSVAIERLVDLEKQSLCKCYMLWTCP